MIQSTTKEIEFELARLEPLAQAEAAFKAANPHEACPEFWDGASARIDALKKERDGIILAAKGEQLASKIQEKHAIEKRIEKAKLERERANKACAILAADPTVARFLTGGSEARRRGWGFSWAASFVPWFLSVDINGKPKARRAGLTDEGAFFTDPQQCPPVLLFTETDRLVILKHNAARGEAILALTVLDGETSQLANLIRQFPELAGVA
jgi:hypothetical protein